MNYHNIVHCDMRNGTGLRVTLFVSGCNHHCKGCHNPQTWGPNSGIEFDESAKQELFAELNKDYISGVTFSGGDPLFPPNREVILSLCKEIKTLYPNKNIWLYTGYKYEQVKHLEILKYIDVLIDGKYVEKLRSVNLPWVGSSNQKVIYVSD